MDAVERSVLRDVHLDECAVVEEEARWDVRHVAASLHPLQEVVQLAPTLVELQPGPADRRDVKAISTSMQVHNTGLETSWLVQHLQQHDLFCS